MVGEEKIFLLNMGICRFPFSHMVKKLHTTIVVIPLPYFPSSYFHQGCVDIYGDHCRVVPVGFPPNLRPEQLRDWEERIQQQAQWVAQNKVRAVVIWI